MDGSADATGEGLYRALFEASRDALMLIDRDGYVDCNEATLELFGVESVDAFRERTPWGLSPPEAPDGRSAEPAARAHIERAFREGSASFDWIHRRADGSTFDAAVTLSRFEHGDQPLLLARVRDVTERKRRERELRELNERLELAIRGANLGVWDWDMVDDEVTFNDQWLAMLGYSPDETDRQFDAWEPAHPEDVADAKAALAAHLDGETEFFETEHRIRTADGDWRWVWDIGKVAAYDDAGNPTRAVGIHLDIHDRKLAEQQVKTQRDNLETLNRVLRHDVRNDLQLVQAHAEARDDGVDDEAPRGHVDSLLESVEHAVGLTRQAGEMAEVMLADERDRRAVALRRTLLKEIEDLRQSYPDAVVETVSIPPVAVSANDMLGSVFRNLLKNAVQHNDADVPRVRVGATERDGSAVVRVADNGPGISDERKEEVFGKGQTGLESSGTGIGLHLVETLVHDYGGTVWAEDDDPWGTVFVVKLPLAE
ncbi:MAG: PAS domain S-box protein [Halobacteriales archaeon]